MLIAFLVLAVLAIAYANGANDNFKGVATLLGSGTCNYHRALIWATVWTLAGSLTAVWLASTLLSSFRGKGLVDDGLAQLPTYGSAVAFAAACTVLIATRVGMPISTTHSLIGALIGAAWAANSAIHLHVLAHKFLLPLIVSPLLAIGSTAFVYPILRILRRKLGVSESTCLCVGSEVAEFAPAMTPAIAQGHPNTLSLRTGTRAGTACAYEGTVMGIDAGATLDWMHYLSAGAVSFARGLNDTPKIAALLMLAPAWGAFTCLVLTGTAIAAGGLVSARRVADTMAHRITSMNHGQGLTANFITTLIVVGASNWGMPVSTTHVSCGSLFGIGTVTGQGHVRTIGTILSAWLVTLPLGGLFGVCGWWLASALTPTA